MFYAIWYHLHNLKNMENIHAGALLLVKLQVSRNASQMFWLFENEKNINP